MPSRGIEEIASGRHNLRANFRKFIFPRRSVDKGKKKRKGRDMAQLAQTL